MIFLLKSFTVHGSTYSNCTDHELRLFGGDTKHEGTIEICVNSAWGTIRLENTHYSSNFAQTVCNMLGYTAPGKYYIATERCDLLNLDVC